MDKEILEKVEIPIEEILEKVKTRFEGIEKKFGKYDHEASENKVFMEKVNKALDELEQLEVKIKAGKFDALAERVTEVEKNTNRPVSGSENENEFYQKQALAVRGFMRGESPAEQKDLGIKPATITAAREQGIEIDGRKIQSVSVDTYSGYLKRPPTYFNEIIKHITEFSPIRQYAKVIPSNADVMVPRRLTAAASSSRMEAESMTEDTTRTYGLEVLTAHEMTVRFDAYFWMLEDAMFPIEAEGKADAAEAFAYQEGGWFVSGSGVGEAEGVMTNANISSRNQEETSTLTGGDALIQLAYDLNDQYTREENRCAYAMRRATLGQVRVLKGGDGHYLYQPMYEDGVRRIEGFKIFTAPDFDAVGANTYPVCVGNWYKGYWIQDKLNMWILKDPFTHSDDGYVTFKYRRRVGGRVVQPNAFKKLKIAVT